jgi:hypothetical protein
LRSRIEDTVGREREAQEILATEVGSKPATKLSRPAWYAVAALSLLLVAIGAYFVRPVGVMKTDNGQAQQALPEEPVESLEDLLEGRDLGEFYALVVGNNRYEKGVPDLDTPINDAQQLATALESRYGFNTQLLLNATRYETLSALESYIDRLDRGDNLMVFYAGHGFVDNVTGRGYWQPTDAEPDSTANWISSLEISDILLDLPAQRVLVVADSCFSGAFAESDFTSLDEASSESTPAEIVERLDLRARRVLSSGDLQPVLDNGFDGHSVFSRALLSALEESPGAIESATLFAFVRHQVSAATLGMELQQQPQFAPLDSDDGGVFLFVPTADSSG